MSLYTYLKNQISLVVKNNGVRAITGDKLQTELFRLIDGVGGLELIGVANLSTTPNTPDKPVMYLAGLKGTYSNFGGIVVSEDICFLCWNGTIWYKVGMNLDTSSVKKYQIFIVENEQTEFTITDFAVDLDATMNDFLVMVDGADQATNCSLDENKIIFLSAQENQTIKVIYLR
jgi:hypothetical protein